MEESRTNHASGYKGSDKKPLLHRRSVVWTVLAIVFLILSAVLSDAFFERFYYKGLFGWIRQVYDFLLGWSPVPVIYLVILFVLVRTLKWSFDWRKERIPYQISRAVGGIAWVVALFYLLWGFNYHQTSLQDRLGFDLEGVTAEDIEAEFDRATKVLQLEAERLPAHYASDESIVSIPVKDHDLRTEVEEALRLLEIPHKGRVRVRQLWPNGFLLRWSTAGIYIPHTGEGHIDRGLLSVQKPFTIAHEMAHGYGVTDEGACNFIAWLACSLSRDQWVRYSGALTYWRYAAAEMKAEKVKAVIPSLPPVVERSLLLIRANDKKYPDIMPAIRDAIYSTYLKRHGVKGGLRSYNYVVMMVHEYLSSKNQKGY